MQQATQSEMQALLDRYGFVPSPECPPQWLRAHTSLVYFILRAHESDPRAPIGLVTAVVEWYRRYDELAKAQPDEQVFEYSHGRVKLRLACTLGCNHCCASPVSVIGPEAVLIAEYIKGKFTPEQRAALDARIEARKLAIAGDQDRNFMCPLNVEGKCSVYPVRPLNCRKWHSFDEGACRKAFLEHDRTALIPRAAVRGDESGLVWQSAVAAFSLLGITLAELDFMTALEVALRSEGVTARFVAGEPLFADAGRRASPG